MKKALITILLISTASLSCMDPNKVTPEEAANEKLSFLLKHKGIDLKTFAYAPTFDPDTLDNDYIKQIIDNIETNYHEDGIVLQKIYNSKKYLLLLDHVIQKIAFLNDAKIISDTKYQSIKAKQKSCMTAYEFYWNLEKVCWIATKIQGTQKQKSLNMLDKVISDIPQLIAKLLNNITFYKGIPRGRRTRCYEIYKVTNTQYIYNLERLLDYVPIVKDTNKQKIDNLFNPIIVSKKEKTSYFNAAIKFKLELLKKLIPQNKSEKKTSGEKND